MGSGVNFGEFFPCSENFFAFPVIFRGDIQISLSSFPIVPKGRVTFFSFFPLFFHDFRGGHESLLSSFPIAPEGRIYHYYIIK